MHGNKKKNGRLVWSVELHNKFIDAVNQLGIEKALPKKILQLMNDEKLTYQHVASHLQKYKLHLKKSSSSISHQQQCSLNDVVVQNIHELLSSKSEQSGQNNNINNEDIHTQIGVFTTSIPSNEQYEWWNDRSLDAIYHSNLFDSFDPEGFTLTNSITFNNSLEDLVSVSSKCNRDSQILAEIAELKQEMAVTRNENLKLREIIQELMAGQDMLMHTLSYRSSHQPAST